MFDPKQWKHVENITVKQFCEYLQEHIPEDALLFVCGDNQVYMHMESDGSIFSIDDNSLSDLPEYDGYEVRELLMCSEAEKTAYTIQNKNGEGAYGK